MQNFGEFSRAIFPSLTEVFQQIFGLNLHIYGVFIKSDPFEFCKSFSLSFSLPNLSYFSLHKLELFIAISIL